MGPDQGKPTYWKQSSGLGDESDELGAVLAGIYKVAQGGSKYQKLITTLKIKGRTLPLKWTLELNYQPFRVHSIKQS